MLQGLWDPSSRKSQRIRKGFMEEVTSELMLTVEYGCVKCRKGIADRATPMGQSLRKTLVSVFPVKAPKTHKTCS